MLQYHQNAYGEEIACLDYAHELLETAKEQGKDHIKFEDWLKKIAKARTRWYVTDIIELKVNHMQGRAQDSRAPQQTNEYFWGLSNKFES